MFYAGDEYADDEATSGPIPDEDFDAERRAIADEYDEMYPQGEDR